MRIFKRSAKRGTTKPAPALVAVVSHTLPALTPVEQTCADQYQRLYRRLIAIAARSLGKDAARDVVHDVYLRLWERWKDLTPEERDDGVVITAVRNKVIDVMRHDSHAVEITEEMEETGEVPSIAPIEPDEEVDFAEVVDSIVAQLSPRCRDTYLMVREQGFTYVQAAAALNIGYESVKTHMKRATFLIREALTDGGYSVAAGEVLKALPSRSEASDD
jgi:RNA polymerase sigma factor (sigma-70 family)